MTDSSTEPYISESLKEQVAAAFYAISSVLSIHLILDGKPKEEADEIKEALIEAWKQVVHEKFQSEIGKYNDVLTSGKVKNAEKITQPEDFQQEFQKIVTEVETGLRKALWPAGSGK